MVSLGVLSFALKVQSGTSTKKPTIPLPLVRADISSHAGPRIYIPCARLVNQWPLLVGVVLLTLCQVTQQRRIGPPKNGSLASQTSRAGHPKSSYFNRSWTGRLCSGNRQFGWVVMCGEGAKGGGHFVDCHFVGEKQCFGLVAVETRKRTGSFC